MVGKVKIKDKCSIQIVYNYIYGVLIYWHYCTNACSHRF